MNDSKMDKRSFLISNLIVSLFLIFLSCSTIPDKPPRIAFDGKYAEDRSKWPQYRFKGHYAIDYYTAPGTPIIAAANGTVEMIFNMDDIMPDT